MAPTLLLFRIIIKIWFFGQDVYRACYFYFIFTFLCLILLQFLYWVVVSHPESVKIWWDASFNKLYMQ